ncbi:Uncharacterised protein [Klebsiella pneumoniae]|nr:Uncharacterised protein [Klebsiella pneumoniae]
MLLSKPFAVLRIFIQLPGFENEQEQLFADGIIYVRKRCRGSREKRYKHVFIVFG